MSAEKLHDGQLELVRLNDLSMATNLADGWHQWRGFVQLLPGESSKIPRLFLVTGNLNDLPRYRQQHFHTGKVEPIGCHFLQDIAISGHLYLFNHGRFITDGSHLSLVARSWLSDYPDHAAGANPERRRITIDEPVIPVGGPGHQVYGHWIIDFLPRVAIAHRLLGERFYDLKMVLMSNTPQWAIDLLVHYFGVSRIITLDGSIEFFCRRVCLPTFAHSNDLLFHSFIHEFYSYQVNHQKFSYIHYGDRQYLSPGSVKGGKRLCVARRVQDTDLRIFLQREYFEEQAVEHGFELIYPEDYSHREQIDIFSDAVMIVGEYGSGMHNSVFCPPGAVVAAVNLLGVEQTRLCSTFDQISIYLPCEEKWRDERDVVAFDVEIKSIDQFFRVLDILPSEPAITLLHCLRHLAL